MDSLNDQEIISAVLTGDMDAYGVLVRRYQKPIFNLMYRVTRSQEDALDLAQETFIRAYEKLDYFKEGARFFPWLYTIGFNHARNFLRKGKGAKSLSIEDWEEKPGGVALSRVEEENLNDRLDGKRLDQALQQLPPDYREAVVLHYHEGLPMVDIAEALHLSVSGAKMRVHRGIKRLREIVKDQP
jgi:RNA polymerase sigma-70 factor, ECF subfamily